MTVQISQCSPNSQQVPGGTPFDIVATLTNDTAIADKATVEFYVDGSSIGQQPAIVPANDTVDVFQETTLDSLGTYNITAEVVSQEQLLIDDFSAGNLDHWWHQVPGYWEISDSPTYRGNYSAMNAVGTDDTQTLLVTTDNHPVQFPHGHAAATAVKATEADQPNTGNLAFVFGYKDPDNYQSVILHYGDQQIAHNRVVEGGASHEITKSANIVPSEFYIVEVWWGVDAADTVHIRLFDTNDNLVAEIENTDAPWHQDAARCGYNTWIANIPFRVDFLHRIA